MSKKQITLSPVMVEFLKLEALIAKVKGEVS